MYNHNKAQQSSNRAHISWDIVYDAPRQTPLIWTAYDMPSKAVGFLNIAAYHFVFNRTKTISKIKYMWWNIISCLNYKSKENIMSAKHYHMYNINHANNALFWSIIIWTKTHD